MSDLLSIKKDFSSRLHSAHLPSSAWSTDWRREKVFYCWLGIAVWKWSDIHICALYSSFFFFL